VLIGFVAFILRFIKSIVFNNESCIWIQPGAVPIEVFLLSAVIAAVVEFSLTTACLPQQSLVPL